MTNHLVTNLSIYLVTKLTPALFHVSSATPALLALVVLLPTLFRAQWLFGFVCFVRFLRLPVSLGGVVLRLISCALSLLHVVSFCDGVLCAQNILFNALQHSPWRPWYRCCFCLLWGLCFRFIYVIVVIRFDFIPVERAAAPASHVESILFLCFARFVGCVTCVHWSCFERTLRCSLQLLILIR